MIFVLFIYFITIWDILVIFHQLLGDFADQELRAVDPFLGWGGGGGGKTKKNVPPPPPPPAGDQRSARKKKKQKNVLFDYKQIIVKITEVKII